MKFKNKTEVKSFLTLNTPFLIKSSRSKTKFVCSFTSAKAFETVIDELADKLWEELDENTEPKS